RQRLFLALFALVGRRGRELRPVEIDRGVGGPLFLRRRRFVRELLGGGRLGALSAGSRQLAHVALQQGEVGVQAVGTRPQRFEQRRQLALHRVDALEHVRSRLVDARDVLVAARGGLVADALG